MFEIKLNRLMNVFVRGACYWTSIKISISTKKAVLKELLGVQIMAWSLSHKHWIPNFGNKYCSGCEHRDLDVSYVHGNLIEQVNCLIDFSSILVSNGFWFLG